jgi:ribosome-associated protein
MLDIRAVSLIADYFVICSGTSERQLRAISNDIAEKLSELGHKPLHTEGVPEAGWILLDYGDVVVHIFSPHERDFYRLEEVWSEAQPVLVIQ